MSARGGARFEVDGGSAVFVGQQGTCMYLEKYKRRCNYRVKGIRRQINHQIAHLDASAKCC